MIVDDVQNELSPQLIESAEKAADLDPRVLDAYIHQCTAEAQEGISLFPPLSTYLSYIVTRAEDIFVQINLRQSLS